MGRFFDFAKRRIVGYIVFWTLVLLFLGVFYKGDTPAQAGGLFVLGFAFLGSLLYTRRMKRKQRDRREAEERAKQMQEQMQEAYQIQLMAQAQRAQQMRQAQQAQQAQQLQQTRQTGGR
jgi:preprotein translocase subunit SecF